MSKLKLYKPSETLTKGNMVRLDSPLFIAVMSEAVNQGIPSYTDYIRSVLAAICLDKTHSSNTEQKTLIAGHKYYTESDIKVYESQIDSLDNQLSNYAIELKNKEVFIQKLHEQHEFQLAQLKAKIPSNLGQNQPNLPNLGVFEIEIQPNLGHQSQPQFQSQPTQPYLLELPLELFGLFHVPTIPIQLGTDLFQLGIEWVVALVEFETVVEGIEPFDVLCPLADSDSAELEFSIWLFLTGHVHVIFDKKYLYF